MSLSIFNFDSLRRALHLPGRTWAWYGALAFFAAGCLLGSSKLLSHQFPHKSDSPFISVSAPLETAEVLILGNSQYLGLNPQHFSRPTANYSVAGSDYSIQLGLLRSLAPKMPRLQFLLLGYDNLPIRTAAIAERSGDMGDLFDAGMRWYALPEHSPLERFKARFYWSKTLRPLLIGPKFDIESLEETFSLRAAMTQTVDHVFPIGIAPSIPRPGFTVAPTQGDKKMGNYVNALRPPNHSEVNLRAFFALLEYCRNAHIRVALLRSPTTKEFFQSRPLEWRVELNTIADKTLATHPDVVVAVWDDESSMTTPIRMFMDPNHLTPEGFRHYTSLLEGRLKNLACAAGEKHAARQFPSMPEGGRRQNPRVRSVDLMPVARGQSTFLSRPVLQTYTSSFACLCNRHKVWTISRPGNWCEVFHGNRASVLQVFQMLVRALGRPLPHRFSWGEN